MGNFKLMINDEILERRQSFRKVLGARVFSTQPGIRAKATDSLQAIPEIKISQLIVSQKIVLNLSHKYRCAMSVRRDRHTSGSKEVLRRNDKCPRCPLICEGNM